VEKIETPRQQIRSNRSSGAERKGSSEKAFVLERFRFF